MVFLSTRILVLVLRWLPSLQWAQPYDLGLMQHGASVGSQLKAAEKPDPGLSMVGCSSQSSL